MITYPMYHVLREYFPVALFQLKFIIGHITAQGARFYILDCQSAKSQNDISSTLPNNFQLVRLQLDTASDITLI